MEGTTLPVQLTDSEDSIYPGFWKRFWAYLLDALIMGVFIIPSMFFFKMGKPLMYITWIAGYILAFITQAYCVVKWGASPGKLITKIYILKMNGEPVGWSEALKRYSVDYLIMLISTIFSIILMAKISNSEYVTFNFKTYVAKIIEIMPSFSAMSEISRAWVIINVVVFFFNKRRRLIGDYIAGTVVAERKYEEKIKTYFAEQKELWGQGSNAANEADKTVG